jgi:hypothetical protein
MKKKYLVEFTYNDGKKEEVELTTDNIKWTIEQYCRNRQIINHQILEEGTSSTKQMLFS